MSAPHPRDADAAEYVLGTLTADERAAVERAAARDPALTGAIRDWENRLAPLAEALPEVTPRPHLRAALDRAIPSTAAAANVLPFAPPTDGLRMRRSRDLWRATTLGATALAASLAGLLLLRAPPNTTSGPDLVAVVNRAGDLPALIVRVDQRAGIVQVRSVAAETPASRSLELWSIAPGASPRSLGVIGSGVTRVALPSGAGVLAPNMTLAVSVEPAGGSTSGAPTGPVVYSGKLLSENP